MTKHKIEDPQHSVRYKVWGVRAVDPDDDNHNVDEDLYVFFDCADKEEAIRRAIEVATNHNFDLPDEWEVFVLTSGDGHIEGVYLEDGFVSYETISATSPPYLPDKALEEEMAKAEKRLLALSEEVKRRSKEA